MLTINEGLQPLLENHHPATPHGRKLELYSVGGGVVGVLSALDGHGAKMGPFHLARTGSDAEHCVESLLLALAAEIADA